VVETLMSAALRPPLRYLTHFGEAIASFGLVTSLSRRPYQVGWVKWVAGVLVEARAGAQVGVVSLSLVSGTIYRASFLSKSPSLRAGQDSEIFEDVVVLRLWRWLPGTRTRNLVHVLVGGLTFGLVGHESWGGYVGMGIRYRGWMVVWFVAARVVCQRVQRPGRRSLRLRLDGTRTRDR